MKLKFKWSAAVVVAVVCGSAFLGMSTRAQERAASNFDRDVTDFDRTRDQVAARLSTTAETLKQIAREAAPEQDSESAKRQRASRIAGAMQSLVADSYGLALETHLLALDNMADRAGSAGEGAVLWMLSSRFKIPIPELEERRTKSGLGLGGVAIGYALAGLANVPVDEIFADKQGNKSWPEIMRDRQVTPDQLKMAFEQR